MVSFSSIVSAAVPIDDVLERAGLTSTPPRRLISGSTSGEVWRVGAFVLKFWSQAPIGFFAAETDGLTKLAEVGVRVPRVHYHDRTAIVMDYLPEGPSDPTDLATQLARLHRTPGADYGREGPMFIGPLELPMSPLFDEWGSFWRQTRIEPLLERCTQSLGVRRARIVTLLEQFQPPVEGPTLIHGDLWSGNVVMTTDGAALIDPSAWFGERGVDLAMMSLFGGFSVGTWSRYHELCPIPTEVREALPFYSLYFLLVHLHLFGSSYLRQIDQVLVHYGV